MGKITKCEKDIGVIGAGNWGKNYIRILNDKRRLHSVCDTEEYVRWMNYVPDDVGCHRQKEKIINNPQIKGVIIATPPETHYAIAADCLDASKHILIEKPVTTTSLEARNILRRQLGTGCVVMVGHLLRYHNAFLEMERLIQERYLGELRYIYANRLNLGRIRSTINVWWSFAPHDVSMVLALADNPVKTVWGKCWKRPKHGFADSTVTFLEFENGVEAHIFVSWLHPVKRHELVCLCEKGMIVFNDCAPWNEKIEVVEMTGGAPVSRKDFKRGFEKVKEREPLLTEIEHFLDCVDDSERDGATKGVMPDTDIREGIRVIEVLEEAQKSMEAKDGK